ncbi:hypothetical protein [Duganella guangzhouensis]|nr:hypothetical protein [Duganella guangzhouensis]
MLTVDYSGRAEIPATSAALLSTKYNSQATHQVTRIGLAFSIFVV